MRGGTRAAAASAVAVLLAASTRAGAQRATSPVPLQGTLVRVEGTVSLKPEQAWDLSAMLGGFNGRWMLGGAVAVAGADLGDEGIFYGLSASGFANYLTRLGPRAHAYLGPWIGFSTEKGGSTAGAYGGQAGLLVSLNAATAVRAELGYRRRTDGPDGTQIGAILDNFVMRAPGNAATPSGSFPEVDVDAVAAYQFQPYRAYRLEGTVAPFLTSWAQLGGAAAYDHIVGFDNSAHLVRGFARAYIAGGRTMRPFAEGIVENSNYDGSDRGLSAYGGAVGLRSHLGAAAALDISLAWLGHPNETFGSTRLRRENDVQLRVRMLTRFRRAPE